MFSKLWIMKKNIWNKYFFSSQWEKHIMDMYSNLQWSCKNILKVTGLIFENYIFLFQFSNWMHFLNISRTLFNYIFITLYYLKLITGLWHYYSYFLHFIVSSCHPFSPFSFLSNLFFYSLDEFTEIERYISI